MNSAKQEYQLKSLTLQDSVIIMISNAAKQKIEQSTCFYSIDL